MIIIGQLCKVWKGNRVSMFIVRGKGKGATLSPPLRRIGKRHLTINYVRAGIHKSKKRCSVVQIHKSMEPSAETGTCAETKR